MRDKTQAIIILLAGNHDKPLTGPYFWEFINHQSNIFYITHPVSDSDIYLLPFSSNPVEDWKDLDLASKSALFMHQTVAGVLVEGDRRLESRHKLPLLPNIPIFSGDVHRPQICGNIVYIGVPHPVRFGESWANRVILIQDGDFKNYREIPVTSIKRDIVDISSSQELNQAKYKSGDMLRVRYNLTGQDLTAWPKEEQFIRNWAKERGVIIASLEAKITGESLKAEAQAVDQLELMKPADVVKTFCEQEKLSQDVLDMGLELLKNT